MTAADSLLKISTYRSLAQSLPVTTLGLGTVLLGGLIGVILNQPSRGDVGTPGALSRVSGAFSLMQSFHGDAKRPVPKLWNQRLGLVRAGNLWKRQGRSIWWARVQALSLFIPGRILHKHSTTCSNVFTSSLRTMTLAFG